MKNQNGAYMLDTTEPLQLPYVDSDPVIFYRVDWLTCIYNDINLRTILDRFFVGVDSVYEIFNNYENYIRCDFGLSPSYAISLNNIRIMFPIAEWVKWSKDDSTSDFFDKLFSSIRVDCSSHGCSYVASLGYESLVDAFCIPNTNYHFTRADFAFDFVNCQGDFLQRTFNQVIEDGALYRGRINTPSAHYKGKDLRIISGSGMTIYVGSTSSKEMLRIYDKTVEYRKKHGSLVNCPYTMIDDNGEAHIPDTWIRFELQLRKAPIIDQFLVQQITTNGIWRYIIDNYSFVTSSFGREGEIYQSWKDISIFADHTLIIQNTNFDDKINSYQKAVNYLPRIRKTLAILMSNNGGDWIYQYMNDYIQQLQKNKDPQSLYQWAQFYKACNENGSAPFLVYNNDTKIYEIRK